MNVITPDGPGTLTDASTGQVVFPDGECGYYAASQITAVGSQKERLSAFVAILTKARDAQWRILDNAPSPASENQNAEYLLFGKLKNLLAEAKRIEGGAL